MDRVDRLAAESGVELPGLDRARRASSRALADIRERVAELEAPPGTCVALMGSIARGEVTEGSDADWGVLAEPGARAEGYRDAVEAALIELGHPPPNPEGPFARVVAVRDLVEKIGADPDTNTNLTRRMLVVLESVPVAGPAVWEAAREAILARYLATLADHVPPRFLLNDVVRYWRTIAVDYESKVKDREGGGWAIRNAKLRLSRKMLFAGGLLPLLECERLAVEEIPPFLRARLDTPPVDRVAGAFLRYGPPGAGVRALVAYSQFLDVLDDPAKRHELESLPLELGRRSAVWREVQSLGAAFQRGLDALLFATPLQATVREYAIF